MHSNFPTEESMHITLGVHVFSVFPHVWRSTISYTEVALKEYTNMMIWTQSLSKEDNPRITLAPSWVTSDMQVKEMWEVFRKFRLCVGLTEKKNEEESVRVPNWDKP